MKTHTTIKNWARATNANIRVTRFNQDHTLDDRYPDVIPTVHVELTLDADAQGRMPQLRIWVPLARRTPLFVFGPDAAEPGDSTVFRGFGEMIAPATAARSWRRRGRHGHGSTAFKFA